LAQQVPVLRVIGARTLRLWGLCVNPARDRRWGFGADLQWYLRQTAA